MGLNESTIPDETIETLSRSFFKEFLNYGFKKVDYLRFVNALLDMAMKNSNDLDETDKPTKPLPKKLSRDHIELPVMCERLCIRPYERKDKKVLQEWLKDKESRQFLLSRSSQTVTLDEFVGDKSCIIGVVTLKSGAPIGIMAYCDYNKHQRRAELRKMIGDPEQRGQGYAREASQLWIRYGIQNLGLKKIYLSTLNTNIRNIKLNEDLGFQVEGILRNEVFFDDQYHDVLRMGMFIE